MIFYQAITFLNSNQKTVTLINITHWAPINNLYCQDPPNWLLLCQTKPNVDSLRVAVPPTEGLVIKRDAYHAAALPLKNKHFCNYPSHQWMHSEVRKGKNVQARSGSPLMRTGSARRKREFHIWVQKACQKKEKLQETRHFFMVCCPHLRQVIRIATLLAVHLTPFYRQLL